MATAPALSDHDALLVAGVDEAGRGPLAGPVVVAAIVYMAVFGRKLLEGESMLERTQAPNRGEQDDLFAAYKLNRNLFKAKVPENSFLIDRPLAESTLREM